MMNMGLPGFWVAVGVSSLLAAGCSHVSLRSGGAHARPLPAEIAAEYACPKGEAFDSKVAILEETAAFVRQRIEIKPTSDGTNTQRRITLDYYHLRSSGKSPVVLVLPMSGGGYSIERHFAHYFASRGYAAVIVHRDKIPKEQQLLENLNPMMHRMVLD